MIEKKSVSFTAKVLTNAQIKALPTTPIEIIPAPGAGKIIVPISAFLHLKTTVAYASFDVLLSFSLIRGTAGSPLFVHTFADDLLDSTANTNGNMLEVTVNDADADVVNKALNLKVDNGSTGDFTGGDAANFLSVSVLYYISNVQL